MKKHLLPILAQDGAMNGSNPEAAPTSLAIPVNGSTALEEADSLMDNFMRGDSKFMSTIQVAPDATDEERRETYIKMYNAISEAKSLRDFVNKPLCVTDFMAHPVVLTDENTGELTPQVRVILVTDKGESYAAVSSGIKNSLERMVAMFGKPTWQPGLWMEANEKAVRSSAMNRVLTIRLLTAAEVPTK